MAREVKLNQLDQVLDDFHYPVAREHLQEETSDVTLSLADGTENLGGIIAGSNEDTFDSVDDVQSEVMNLLPRHAVGEPFQSEGDG